jgi:hypothetical protein
MFKVYSFDYDTGIYTGWRFLDISDADPRSPGIFLMPGNTTTEPPPRCGRGLFPVWKDGQWTVCQRELDFDLDADYYAHL